MKQLVIAVLVAALLSLGIRLASTFTADADSGAAPPPAKQEAPQEQQPKDSIQPAAVRVDRPSAEREPARDETTGPNRTRRGDAASQRSPAVPRSAAKPLIGAEAADLATARTPPAMPPKPRMFGPDGVVFQRLDTASPRVSGVRMTPPSVEESLVQAPPSAPQRELVAPPVVRNEKPLSPEPLPPAPTVTPAHGRMVGPDGIEFHAVQRVH